MKRQAGKNRILMAAALLTALTLVLCLISCGAEQPDRKSSEDRGTETTADEAPTAEPTLSEAETDEGPNAEPTLPEKETTEDGTVEDPAPEETTEADLPFIDGYRVKVTVTSARIRSEASLARDDNVVGGAFEGDVFDVLGTSGSFYVIDFEGRKAFISGTVVDYGPFEKTEPETTVPPTTVPPSTRPKTNYQPTNTLTVCIDAGHRRGGGISETEPNGPGSSVMKAKLTTGTQGLAERPEHEVNLEVAVKLQAILEARGYTVVMVRDYSNPDCTLSNAERAQFANSVQAGAFVRIHCNGSSDESVHGALTYSPSPSNPYMGPGLINESIRLSNEVRLGVIAATGAKDCGNLYSDEMTGINWCEVPVTIIEMGFMTNREEAVLLCDDAYQNQIAEGMADGLDRYFNR